jgi:hypothetical protein
MNEPEQSVGADAKSVASWLRLRNTQVSNHDWHQYEESPGNGRANSGWYVWKKFDDGRAIEMDLTRSGSEWKPVEVALVRYGPRGGTQVIASGTIASLQNQYILNWLLREAQDIEALR